MLLTCRIELPLPPKELMPNGRPHWRAKAKKVKEYRGRAKTLARRAIGDRGDHKPHEAAVVRVSYWNKTARRLDPDNIIAAMKSAMDGFTDAGVWEDDCDVVYLPPFRGKDANDPRVVVEIYGATLDEIRQLTEQMRGQKDEQIE